MRASISVQGDLTPANIMQLEYSVEDLRGVSRANFDSHELRLLIEYDEFLVTPGEIIRAIEEGRKFKVSNFS